MSETDIALDNMIDSLDVAEITASLAMLEMLKRENIPAEKWGHILAIGLASWEHPKVRAIFEQPEVCTDPPGDVT